MDSYNAYWEGVDRARKKILESLETDGASRVILAGEAGTGKTWMARQVFELAVKSRSCYVALWLNLNKEMNEMSLYEDIASQLSLFLEKKEGEDDDDNENEEDQTIIDLMRVKDQIRKKISKKKLKCRGQEYILLVLDDEGSVTKEEKVMKDLYLRNFLVRGKDRSLKILLTRRKDKDPSFSEGEIESHDTDELYAPSDGEIQSHATDEVYAHSDGEIQSHAIDESHTIDESQTLLNILTDDDYLMGLLGSLIKGESLAIFRYLEELWGTKNILRMSLRLPAALVILAKSLNRFCQLYLDRGPQYLLDRFSNPVISFFRPDTISRSRENPFLQFSYELLQTDDNMKSSIADCFWHSLSYFEHRGCVNYQELIAHWILEGYFDPVRSVAKAYKDGHAILMELIKRGFMKIQEENVAMPEVAMKNIIDLRRCGLSSTSRIRLAKFRGSDRTKGLGKINLVDDIIEGKTKGKKFTTVLVSGNRLRRENLIKYFMNLRGLEVLCLLDPKLGTFFPMLSGLVELRVLVIRDCSLLKDIEDLKALQGLHVLEVSGASSLKEISDGFFTAMPDLQSLHLSGLQIKSSPSSISQLKKLHCLIIRDCPVLEDLPDIQELVKLEVVDVSGACRLQTCFDKEKGEIKNKNFYHLTRLQLLDFSESQIERLPIFQDSAVGAKLHSLTRLLLRNCSKLRKLPNLKPLSGLQTLDLSGTTSLVKMREVCFQDKKELRILNLSGTKLRQLPSTIQELSNLNNLVLRDCTNLEYIPNIQQLMNLEVVDVSGCIELNKIEGSFENMIYLREVNFFGTKVMITPDFLPKESEINIRCRKRFIGADGRSFESDNWRDLTKSIMQEISDEASSSTEVVRSQEISEKEAAGEIQLDESRTRDGTENDIYVNILLSVVNTIPQEVMEINETTESSEEALTKAEFLSFVNVSTTKLTSVFNKINSAKGCWIKESSDIKDLFFEVEEARLGSLETLSITNIPGLDSISRGGSFKNLKNLIVVNCPNIKTIFSEASQLPSSLKELHIMYCEKLEKVFKDGEVPTLTTMCLVGLPELSYLGARLPNLETLVKRDCPKLLAEKEDLKSLDWVVVDHYDP